MDKSMDVAERIIVALDTSPEQSLLLAEQLQGKATWLKVGMTLYYEAGPAIVAALKEKGYKIFVDLKLHDIPHQVRGAARSVAAAGADMLTVHASGGADMMQAACWGAELGYKARKATSLDSDEHQSVKRPLCLAVTVLTSLDTRVLEAIGVNSDMTTQALRLAQLAKGAGMDGVVCSPVETEIIRREMGPEFALVTPGVRPVGADLGDQARVATPASALGAGADYLVIGRPITEAVDPRAAFEAIVSEMQLSAS